MRVLETANKLCSLQYDTKEEIEALEKRVGEQYTEWSTFMGQTLDKITEKMDFSEKREFADRAKREAQLQRHFLTYNERLTHLEDRFQAHTLSVEKMGEDLRMGLGVASSSIQGLEKNMQGLSSKLLLMDCSMTEDKRQTHQLLNQIKRGESVGGSQQLGMGGDIEILRQDLEALRLVVTRNYEELRSQNRADHERQTNHEQGIRQMLQEFSADLEKKTPVQISQDREFISLQYDVHAQKEALVRLAKNMDEVSEEKIRHFQRQVGERMAKTDELIQNIGTKFTGVSKAKMREYQRLVGERLQNNDESLDRLVRSQEEMKKAMREVAEYLGRLPRPVRRPKTRPSGPALPAAPGDAGLVTSGLLIPPVAEPPRTHSGSRTITRSDFPMGEPEREVGASSKTIMHPPQ